MSRLATAPLLFALVGATALVGAPASAAPAGEAQATATERAKGLYDEGRKAYRKGDMQLAVDKFEEAYDLTENPIILYNIGLAYRRLYDESKNIAHLRRAKVVLENFRLELARDSGLGSPDEVASVLAEVEKMLDAEDGTRSATTAEAPVDDATESDPAEVEVEAIPEGPEREDSTPPPARTDSSRGLRIGGYAALGTGAALGIGAGVVVAVFLGKRADHLAALDESVANAQAEGCTDSNTDGVCGEYLDEREALTVNANLAQDRAVLGGATLGSVAVLSLGAGAALLVLAKKRARKTASLRVGPWGQGVQVSGRF